MVVGDYISEIQTSDGSTYPIGSSVWVSSETWNGKTKTEVEHEIKTKFINLTEITWSSLKSLADAGTLIPGQYYRITDYTCTTTIVNTKSAGHVFDIIVRADSVNKLNEEAHAIQHTGDSYFTNSNLSAWRLWYCLDNDTTRFAWADSTNGKGVIYRMIDEFNNDVPYDFKNIQFYRQWDSYKSLWCTISSDTTGVPCYTFSSYGDGSAVEFTDFSLSLSNNVYSNVIKEYIKSQKQTLNNNCFFGYNCYSNTFGINCLNNTFGYECYSNTFGFGCYSNTFKYKCQYNTFRRFCYSNTFGNDCEFNTFGNYCQYTTFGINCQHNTFGNDCYANTFGNDCQFNTFGNKYLRNTFGDKCYSNTFGNGCSYNTFGNYCQFNTFGNGCIYIQFTSNSSASTTYSYYRDNYFGDGCSYILFKGAATGSDSVQVQNYNFSQGLQGASDAYLTIDGVRNRTYETKVAKNSYGTLKIYCEADLVQ